MGLDITAYSGLVPAEGDEAYDDKGEIRYEDDWTPFYKNDAFPGRADEIESGKAYHVDDSFSFRAGSYSLYNAWREELALMAGLGTPQQVWADPKEGPFVELVHFSDCEGVIGAAVSAKLAKDFAQFQALADEHSNEWFQEKYAQWRKAFEMASNNGVVEFH